MFRLVSQAASIRSSRNNQVTRLRLVISQLPLRRYPETSRSRTVEQMEHNGQQEVSPRFLPLTDPAADQTTAAEDAFLDVLQKPDSDCLLAELIRIERELRERLRAEEERRRKLEHVRQEANRQRWRSLCFLVLNQRTAKPWVTSYYKNIPMHIYCLPIESENQQLRKKKKMTKKKECN